MIIRTGVAVMMLAALAAPAEARRHSAGPAVPAGELNRLKQEVVAFRQEIRLLRDLLRPQASVAALSELPAPSSPIVASLPPTSATVDPPALGKDQALRGVASVTRLPDPLKAALAKVQSACEGFKVISACRPGARVRGSGRVSLHASCRAADFKVSRYSCAYGALQGFPGGVSTDPGRVAHIHISYAPHGREWGARFAHWQPHRVHSRFAHRHGRRYARV